jgi:hypothetical protein
VGIVFLKALVAALLAGLFRQAFVARWHDHTLRRESLVLRPGKALLVAAVGIVILGPIASWLMCTTFREFRGSATAARNATFAALGCVALGLYFALRAVAPVVLVSRAGLVQRTTLFRVRRLAWRNVRGIRYHSGWGSIQIIGPRFSISVGLMAGGISALLDRIELSVPAANQRTRCCR